MTGAIAAFLRDVFDPRPHREATTVSEAATKVETASKRITGQRDEFGDMVRGLRGEAPKGARRGRRKK